MASSLETLESEIVAQALQSGDPSLARGTAGALVFQAHLYAGEQTVARRLRVKALMAALVASVQERELAPGLWHGLAGVLYALEFLRGAAADLLPQEVAEFVLEMDDQLVAYVSTDVSNLHFSLADGIAGIGAYALMRSDPVAAARLYAAVEAALLQMAGNESGGRTWLTRGEFMRRLVPVELRARGYIDLGIMNGLAGLVLLFAGAVRHGVGSPDTPALSRATACSLLGYRQPPIDGATFAPYASAWAEIPQPAPGGGLAWCYGDLGIGFSMYCAGNALGDEALLAAGRQIATQRLLSRPETFLPGDDSLCHGRAGAAHLIAKMFGPYPPATGLPAGHLVDPRRQVISGDLAGLLGGRAGTLLSTHDGIRRGRHHWDVCMCLGF